MPLDPEIEREAWEGLQTNWPLVARELETRARGCSAKLADRKETSDMDAVRTLQARIESCKWLINLPQRKIDKLTK